VNAATIGSDGVAVLVNSTPDGGVVSGDGPGLYAPPFLSGGNGVHFGNPLNGSNNQADGADATPYLTSGAPGTAGSFVSLTFPGNELYVGLLWGSVDSPSAPYSTANTLSFYDASNTLIGIVTGDDVLASPNGDQGVLGTVYVNIVSDTPFARVVATSNPLHAFEFDNVAYNPSGLGAVPEASSVAIWALLGAFGAAAMVIQKKQRVACLGL
jgi:hypothetical protein